MEIKGCLNVVVYIYMSFFLINYFVYVRNKKWTHILRKLYNNNNYCNYSNYNSGTSYIPEHFFVGDIILMC